MYHIRVYGPQAEAQANIASCDCPEYLRRAERRLQQELERVGHYLDSRSEPKLTRVAETELLQKQVYLPFFSEAC